MLASRAVIERLIESGDAVYGVNTGFGKLASVRISREQIGELQVNLVRSHACGIGAPLSEYETRAMLAAARERDCQGVFRRAAGGGGDFVRDAECRSASA